MAGERLQFGQPYEAPGALRLRVTDLGGRAFRLEWCPVDPANPSVLGPPAFAEEVRLPADRAGFASQLVLGGHLGPSPVAVPTPGFYVDGRGARHFVTEAEPGAIGTNGGLTHLQRSDP